MPARDVDDIKILEISAAGYCKSLFPQRTRLFDTGVWNSAASSGDPQGLAALAHELRTGDHDIVLCAPGLRGPWRWQTISRLIFNRRIATNLRRPLRHYGPQLLRFHRNAPLAIVDFEDTPFIERDNFFLLDRATLYFKRELPVDEWRLLTKTASDTLPSGRMRRAARFQKGLAKVRPLPLGLPKGWDADIPAEPLQKRTDIFFAGTVEGFPVRQRALAELEMLRAEGLTIDVPQTMVPRAEFYRRCAEAWLTLSPEGFGWDCFRHYEAAACGSVPLINQPTIRRFAPFVEGEHAFFFHAEPGELARAARAALADKERLRAMAVRARAHVLAHHTPEAVMRYVIDATLAEG